MSISYRVVFENHNTEYKIAGVATTREEMNKLISIVSSRGPEYSALSIEYLCNTPLNDEFFIVYTRALNDVDNEVDTFHKMVLTEGEKVPSDKDVFLYKLEKSATERVGKINDTIKEAGLNDREAVMVTTNLNTLYNIEKPKEEIDEEVINEEPSEENEVI